MEPAIEDAISFGGCEVRPMLILEMNEIPWRLIDLYRKDPRYPAIAAFFDGARTYTSVTVDSGELSPWVTWPSLHRGMGNGEHGIQNLGQNPATFKGTPIWEEFRKRGHAIGICGSMQSWPPTDPGSGGFYIPDTFAHDPKTIPPYIEPFQTFNLGQVKRNGRVVEGGVPPRKEWASLLVSLPRLGISMRTLALLSGQLLGERFNRTRVSRRPIFQAILMWDVFKSLFDPNKPPAFSTFFTNHVAGVMHRYWHHVFPEDFGDRYAGKPLVHRETMDFAMKVVDGMLAEAIGWKEKRPDLLIVFATSMGQNTVLRDEQEGYAASIPDIDTFMSAMGMEKDDYKSLLAMVPQVAVEIADSGKRAALKERLDACQMRSGKPLFRIREIGPSLSITVFTPRIPEIKEGVLTLPWSGARIRWEQAGIRMNKVDPGTAYHIPEGILAVTGAGIEPRDSRDSVPADSIKAMLAEWAGLAPDVAEPGEPTIADRPGRNGKR